MYTGQQIGGRLLGQGAFGCTFDPAPRCANGSVFKKVGGLQAVGKITTEDSRAELAAGRAIMRLPLADNYFALPTESCTPEMPTGDQDEKKCRVMQHTERDPKFSMLIMPSAGEQIAAWGRDFGRCAEEYVELFVHLLEGMVIYQNAGYVHNDIHMGNILVDPQGVARYIDFGLAFNVTAVKSLREANFGSRFRPDKYWQAPEIHAWRMRLNGVRISDGAKQMLENYEIAAVEKQFPSRPGLEQSLVSFLAVTDRDEAAFLKQYATGIDCWRIGMVFWMLWDDMLVWSGLQQTTLWQYRDGVRQVLSGLTEFDPRRRWSARKALAFLSPGNRLSSDNTMQTVS